MTILDRRLFLQFFRTEISQYSWLFSLSRKKCSTVKPAYNDHTWEPKLVAVVDRWSLFRGHLRNINKNKTPKCWLVVANQRWSSTQVWLYLKILNENLLCFESSNHRRLDFWYTIIWITSESKLKFDSWELHYWWVLYVL